MGGPWSAWAVGLIGVFGLLAALELGLRFLWSAVIGDRETGDS